MKRILIVDDDMLIRQMLCQLFEDHNYEVMEAADGKKGIKLFQEKGADLILTDIIMPEKEGIEMILEVKQISDVKIIAISGGGRIKGDVYLKLAEQMGVDRVFSKPINTQELLNAVKELIG